jgi:hypothetical protein
MGKAATWAAAALLALSALPAAATAPAPSWPPFLPASNTYTEDVREAVQQTWMHATFSRTVHGRPARVSVSLFAALVDAPELTAAAARVRGFARDDVRMVAEDWYEAEDQAGARGYYRVLWRDPSHRVMLSWGEHESTFLGTVRGSALTVLEFEPRGPDVDAHLTAYVRIENPVAAVLARVLVVLFGRVADRHLKDGFEIAARVAAWAVTDPAGFCRWLGETPAAPERRARIMDALPTCPQPPTQDGGRPPASLAEGSHAR